MLALQELGIPRSKLTSTNTSNQGNDKEIQNPIGKIRIRFQLGDLISKVTLHVVNTRACYNILLERIWLHDYAIVPSTPHQCLKYIDDNGIVSHVAADDKPFKGKEVYFTDVAMYEERVEKPKSKKEKANLFWKMI